MASVHPFRHFIRITGLIGFSKLSRIGLAGHDCHASRKAGPPCIFWAGHCGLQARISDNSKTARQATENEHIRHAGFKGFESLLARACLVVK